MILSSGYPYKLVLISLDWKECSSYAIAYASCFQWGDYFTQLRREKLCHQLRKVKVFQVGIILEEVNFKPKKTVCYYSTYEPKSLHQSVSNIKAHILVTLSYQISYIKLKYL